MIAIAALLAGVPCAHAAPDSRQVLVLPAVKGARIAPSARETQRALEDGLGPRLRARWGVLRQALLAEGRGAAGARAADPVAAAISAAREDYVAQRFAEMTKRLLAVEAANLARLSRPQGRAQAVLLNQLLAIAALSGGDETSADARFRLMLALDGSAHIDGALYPPKIVARFTQVRADVGRLSPTAVALTSAPGDVELVVDGRPTESEALKLRPGLHYVRVRALGYRDDARKIEVTAGGTQLRVELAALAAGARRGQLARSIADGSLDARLPAARRAVARALGAKGILFWSSLADGRLRVGYTSASADGNARNLPAAAAKRAYDIVVLGAALEQGGGRQRAAAAPFYTRWWFWTIAGAVVAGSVTAAVLATQLGGADSAVIRFGAATEQVP